MKQFILLGVLVIIGICQGKTVEHGIAHVLHRVTRQVMGNTAFTRLENLIVQQCGKNNHSELENTLETTYNNMTLCIRKKIIFLTDREKFIENLETCTRDAITETKKCLKTNEKYLPELFLAIAKSLVNFMYDDFTEMNSRHMTVCILKFIQRENQEKYIQCMRNVSKEIHGDGQSEFPASKEEFCGDFIKASTCFTSTLGTVCDDTTEVHQFREDYLNALRRPCGISEQTIDHKQA